MLAVSPGREVLVNGKERVLGVERAIVCPATGLAFGDLAYELEFTQRNEERYRHQLQKYRSDFSESSKEPPSLLEINPSEQHYEYH